MKFIFSLLALASISIFCTAQELPLADSLRARLDSETTPAGKIKVLGSLADLYMNLNQSLSDEYGKKQLEIAELGRDRKLMLEALLSHSNRFYNSGGVQAHLDKGKMYANRALELARSSHLDEYVAWSYMYVARGARNDGEKDKALTFNNLAVSIASTLDNDSLKISAFNSLGGTYLVRGEKLLAFRNFAQAMNLAETINNYELLKRCLYNMSSFYQELEDYEKAKDYLFRLLDLSRRSDERWDRLEIYSNIGNVYVRTKQYDLAQEFYEKSMKLADSLDFSIYKLNLYGRIFDLYFTSNQAAKALQYFNEKRELKDFLLNAGFKFYIDHAYGQVYTALKKYDSAHYFFQLAEPGFETKANSYNRYYFYSNYATYFSKTGNYRKSLDYWLKAKNLADERGDIGMLQIVSQKLDSVYQKVGDFQAAYFYNTRYNHYKDSLENLATEKDLLLLEVDNENKRKDREATLAEAAKRERHNLQYMGITTAIAAVFIVLVMLGIFSVSKATIRILGFFAFIFLFEFIILLADHQIHDWTHGEPWKILAIKIALISVLLPLHHFLEQKVIHYLTSRKLIEVNPKELLYKISGKGGEPVSH